MLSGHDSAQRIFSTLTPLGEPAGELIVSTVMEKLGSTSLVVSDRGLRHGPIRERFGLF